MKIHELKPGQKFKCLDARGKERTLYFRKQNGNHCEVVFRKDFVNKTDGHLQLPISTIVTLL